MANPLRGEAEIVVDGASLKLVIDVNALVEVEDATGMDVTSLSKALSAKPGFKLIRTLFWAALQARHPGKTERDAGDIMSSMGVEAITETLTKLFQSAFPTATKASAEGKAKTVAAGTG